MTEGERGIVGSIPGTEDFRTLVPASERYGLNGTFNRGLSEKTAATINLRYDHSETDALFGVLGADPLLALGPEIALH